MTHPASITQRGAAVRLSVRVQPRASRSELAGEHAGALKIRLAAPPVDGEANRELIHFLSRLLDVPRSSIRIVSGETSRNKVVDVDDVDAAFVAQRVRRQS